MCEWSRAEHLGGAQAQASPLPPSQATVSPVGLAEADSTPALEPLFLAVAQVSLNWEHLPCLMELMSSNLGMPSLPVGGLFYLAPNK